MNAATDTDIEVGRRLPVADATLRLLNYATEEAFLDDVFQRYRGRAFERELRFPVFVHLIADALLGHRGSAHQTFLQSQQENTLSTSVQAVYNRLATLPIQVSLGFFAEAAARLAAVSGCPVDPLPVSLVHFWATAVDGKKLKYVQKRLKPLRGLKGNVLGGKILVAQDMATLQTIAVQADVDGEAADNPLVPGLLARVRAASQGKPILWVEDRGFCDFKTLHLLSEGSDAFLVRHHKKCGFHLDPTIPTRTGIDDVGRTFREEWGWIGAAENKNRVRVRKITVERPGAEPLTLLTSLMDADRYPAFDLLILYRRRWGIETMFQKIVQTFNLRNLIGGTAEATIFQAVFCMLLYNITLIVRDHVAAGAQQVPKTVSLDLLFGDMVDELTAWMKVITPALTLAVLSATIVMGPEEFKRYLERKLAGVWTARMAKAKTTKRAPKKPPRAYLKGGHSSVDRIRRGVHEEIPIKRRKPA